MGSIEVLKDDIMTEVLAAVGDWDWTVVIPTPVDDHIWNAMYDDASGPDATVIVIGTPPATPTPSTRRRGGRGRIVPQKRECLDGCGRLTGGYFAPGHDSKLKSILIECRRFQSEYRWNRVPVNARPYVRQFWTQWKITLSKPPEDYGMPTDEDWMLGRR